MLESKLVNFNEALTEAEKANFKLILGLAAGGLAPSFQKPHEGIVAEAFNEVCKTLAQLQPYKKRVGNNGLAFRGYPPLLDTLLLQKLKDESSKVRPSAIRYEEHFVGCGAPIANELATSNELTEFVRIYAGDVLPTGIASYLYYDEPGQGIDPHIDTDIFSLNILIMLEHLSIEPSRSALVLFPPNSDPLRLDLVPGEMVIMFAGSIAHGREKIRKGENISILTIGFHPLGV